MPVFFCFCCPYTNDEEKTKLLDKSPKDKEELYKKYASILIYRCPLCKKSIQGKDGIYSKINDMYYCSKKCIPSRDLYVIEEYINS